MTPFVFGPLPRDLTPEERALWGECPVCNAPHGQPCNTSKYPAFVAESQTHISRLWRAPRRGRIAAAD